MEPTHASADGAEHQVEATIPVKMQDTSNFSQLWTKKSNKINTLTAHNQIQWILANVSRYHES